MHAIRALCWKEITSSKRALQTYKPDSVPVSRPLPFIWASASRRGSALPTPLAGPQKSQCASHTSSVGAEGKVYLAFQPARFIRTSTCAEAPCALTARFHPYLRSRRPVAVFFCDPLCASTVVETPPVRWCGALCCPDFPPRSPKEQRRQSSLQCYIFKGVVNVSQLISIADSWHDFLVLQGASLA